MRRLTLLLILVTCFASAGAATDGNWTQWRGPNRDGVSAETGLLKQWPAGGPPVAWTATGLGNGYGSVAIVGDRLYVQGTAGSSSAVICLRRSDGKPVWTRTLGRALDQDRGGGPRGTPTVDGDVLYALTEAGDLASLRLSDGSVVWTRNMLSDFGGRNPEWHISESPLVDGPHLIVTPGGPGAGLAALDKKTGKTVWTTKDLSDQAGYASAIVADVQGVRTIMTLTAGAAVGVRANDGKLMWRYTKASNTTANVTTPVFFDNRVFVTTAYNTGAALLQLKAANGEVTATEVYFTREMMNHHGGVVLLNGYLYGFSNAILTCLNAATGAVQWKNRSVGKGSLTYADGMLYVLGEDFTVGLVEASPAAYTERGRFQIGDQGWPSWAHPVVAGGRLYLRNQGVLSSYVVTAK
ncbi:MAG: PQQ-like beta-propeller repeat protein [Vicinamibacterales bacterium]|nr:PQQ-like beta-propeller repeat protein [Vicinamibacterales bacterium]